MYRLHSFIFALLLLCLYDTVLHLGMLLDFVISSFDGLFISLIFSHTVLCSISTDPFPFLSSISLDVELRTILRVLVNSIYRPALEAFAIQLDHL